MRFEKLKNDILGKKYSLSIAYVSEKKSREINKKYRKKDKATNVLSFSLRKNEGELVLCRTLIKKEAKKIKRTSGEWLGFLVIHGMLHLKGLRHSSTMERAEKKYDQKYNSRDRRRLLKDKSRGGRVFKRRKKS
ncbi:MAG: rRNA maturation RNase YbeY [Patescibacteria group bacterium]